MKFEKSLKKFKKLQEKKLRLKKFKNKKAKNLKKNKSIFFKNFK
jgi:hypothetical protein